jgi:hypothetical protein
MNEIKQLKKIKILTIVFFLSASQLKSGEPEPWEEQAPRGRIGAISFKSLEEKLKQDVSQIKNAINESYDATFGKKNIKFFDYDNLVDWLRLFAFDATWPRTDKSFKDFVEPNGTKEISKLAKQVVDQKQEIIKVLTALRDLAKEKGAVSEKQIKAATKKLKQIQTTLNGLLEKNQSQMPKYGAKLTAQTAAADLVAYYAQKLNEAINKILKSAPAS